MIEFMRLDLFLCKTGLAKRRTLAKEIADAGLVKVNSQKAKPGREINERDIIEIGGNRAVAVEVLMIPGGSVRKEDREKYYKIISGSNTA
jgi:ribosomal 50S subunit-recycling heat shock protein